MHRLVLLSAVAMTGALLMPAASMASQERLMDLGELRVTSPGVAESGPFVVTAIRGAHGFGALQVQAFGRVTRLTVDQLAQLRLPFVDGVQLTYDGGYKELGGRTLRVVLRSEDVFTGVQQTQAVFVNEQGAVRIAPPTRASR